MDMQMRVTSSKRVQDCALVPYQTSTVLRLMPQREKVVHYINACQFNEYKDRQVENPLSKFVPYRQSSGFSLQCRSCEGPSAGRLPNLGFCKPFKQTSEKVRSVLTTSVEDNLDKIASVLRQKSYESLKQAETILMKLLTLRQSVILKPISKWCWDLRMIGVQPVSKL